MAAGAGGTDGVLGRVPQSVVDDEEGGLRSTLAAALELRGLGRVADNAQQQYVRSRPAPSPESIKRAKELDLAGLGLHPLFSESLQGAWGGGQRVGPVEPPRPHTSSSPCPPGSRFEEKELQRLKLVDSIKSYRSRTVSQGVGEPTGSRGHGGCHGARTLAELLTPSRTPAGLFF